MNTEMKIEDYSWFQLDRYNELYDLPIEKLIEEMKLRFWLYRGNIIDTQNNELITSVREHFEQYWVNRFKEGKVKGSDYGEYMDRAHLPFLYQPTKPASDPLAGPKLDPMISITPITYGLFFDAVDLLKKEFEQEVRDARREFGERYAQEYHDEVRKMAMFTGGTTVVLEVDLACPSKLIIKDLKRLLSTAKPSLAMGINGISQWSESKLTVMRQRRVFEQLDIRIVSRVYNDDLSIADLCRLVFPEHNHDFNEFYEVFRRVHYKFASEVCTYEGFRRLEALEDTVRSSNRKSANNIPKQKKLDA